MTSRTAESESSRFAYEWSRYPEIIPTYESMFRSWTAPAAPSDFRGKRVLDAGCGTGRNSYWALSYGAESVVAFDLDPRIVEVARRNLAAEPRAEVRRLSIYEEGFDVEFDLTMCIGVLHHLHDPGLAMKNLVRATRVGGVVLAWIYALEGHTLFKRFLRGLRTVTRRSPPTLVEAVALPLSTLAYLGLRSGLFRHPYARHYRRSPFWHVHSVMLDQLLPGIAHYWRRAEALALFDNLPVTDVKIEFVNRGSWTVWARRA